MNYHKLITLFIGVFLMLSASFAQHSNNAYFSYVEQYKALAIDHMQRYRIPASITLAQGLLESAAGQSFLARTANNHFGIKAGTDWTGPVVIKHDDSPDEKFRKYNSVAESYEDHSLFLQKPRYGALYQLPLTDYRGWAHTLKQCGYATNPRYADNLISIIERYNLMQYDQQQSVSYAQNFSTQNQSRMSRHKQRKLRTLKLGTWEVEAPTAEQRTLEIQESYLLSHHIGKNNGVFYIIVQPGDNLKSIAKATGKDSRKIRRYNHIPRGADVYEGQIIYLGKKPESNFTMRNHPHEVQIGESLYDISQRYGIRIQSLYKMNDLSNDYEPRVGDRIILWK